MPPVGSKPDSYINMKKMYLVGRGGGIRAQQGFGESFFLKLGKLYTDFDDSNSFVSYVSKVYDPNARLPPELLLNEWCP